MFHEKFTHLEGKGLFSRGILRIPRGSKWDVLSRLASSPRSTPAYVSRRCAWRERADLSFRSKYLCCVLESGTEEVQLGRAVPLEW